MALTKAQVRSMIRSLMPDQAKQAWSDSALDVLTQLVMDEQAARIMDAGAHFRSQLDTIAIASITSPGYVDLSSAGPLTKRFYRMQSVRRDDQEFSPIHPRDVVMFSNEEVVTSTFGYYISGQKLWMFPLRLTCTIEVEYSYLPALFTALADTAAIDWPSGFEGSVIHEVVARTSSSETTINQNHAIAENILDVLKSKAVREYVGPSVMRTYEAAIELGGEDVA